MNYCLERDLCWSCIRKPEYAVMPDVKGLAACYDTYIEVMAESRLIVGCALLPGVSDVIKYITKPSLQGGRPSTPSPNITTIYVCMGTAESVTVPPFFR